MRTANSQRMAENATLSAEEDERVQTLASLEILDTPPEERYDRLCRLAKELLQTPAAYISVIDRDRQWFKSACGMGDLKETPRSRTFCDFAIRRAEPTLILDAEKHPVFHDSPYVVGAPFVKFYLGYPLSVQGQRVGTLCALDFQAREEVSQVQMDNLEILARIAETELLLKDTLQTQSLLLQNQSELRERNAFVRRVLGRYVTDEVATHILAAPEELHLGGERREVSILMADLRGFTPMSDRLDPETVVTILNHYLHYMVEVVLKWGGTIDEIIGDALLIIFGAPLEQADHARRAACCALDMQLAMERVNQTLAQEDLPTIACGVGLNTGEVVVGNIGSEKRMKYSVVGSPVNLTARIESLTIGGQILASESTIGRLGAEARIDGKLRVKMKGYDRPITIYEIGGMGELELPSLIEETAGSRNFSGN